MRPRFRPSPPMIVACIALFVALGGAATAVTYVVSSNSQVGPGTISGHKPPSGKHANIIGDSVNGQDLSGTLKSSLRLHCPSDLQPVPDQAAVLCAETSLRGPDSYLTALGRCAAVNLRLPTDGELALVFQNSAAPQTTQWTSSHYFDEATPNTFWASALSSDAGRNLHISTSNGSNSYRCVTTPRN